MSEPREENRAAWVAIHVVVYGLSATVMIAFVLQLLMLFILVTLGPAVLIGVPDIDALEHFRWFYLSISVGLAVGALTLIAALTTSRFKWSCRTALIPLPIVALIASAASSYRLIGLGMLLLTLVLYGQCLRGKLAFRYVVTACLAFVLTSALPVDVSLQNVPGKARIVPAISGLLSREGDEMATRGEAVVVGGCVAQYHEPTWVWVW